MHASSAGYNEPEDTTASSCGIYMKAKYRTELAELAQKIVGDLAISQVAYKTGISYETCRQLIKFGHVPSEEKLEEFAKGLNADLRELRIAAGYAEEPLNADEKFIIHAYRGGDPKARKQLEEIARKIVAEEEQELNGNAGT